VENISRKCMMFVEAAIPQRKYFFYKSPWRATE
jgi:hypothetical protein